MTKVTINKNNLKPVLFSDINIGNYFTYGNKSGLLLKLSEDEVWSFGEDAAPKLISQFAYRSEGYKFIPVSKVSFEV